MSRMEKSDSAIGAGKPANKEGQPTAERAEQRAGTKENPGGRNACRAQSRESAEQATERIRQAVKRNPQERLTALLHHVSVDALRVSYLGLRSDAAAGVDGMMWRVILRSKSGFTFVVCGWRSHHIRNTRPPDDRL